MTVLAFLCVLGSVQAALLGTVLLAAAVMRSAGIGGIIGCPDSEHKPRENRS